MIYDILNYPYVSSTLDYSGHCYFCSNPYDYSLVFLLLKEYLQMFLEPTYRPEL